MFSRVAIVLDKLSIRNLGLLYFFLCPVFLERMNPTGTIVVFTVGYLLSGTIVILGLSERLLAFDGTVRYQWPSLLFIAMVALCFLGLLINTPRQLISLGPYLAKYLKIILPSACFFIMMNLFRKRDLPRLYTLLLIFAAVSAIMLIPEYILLPGSRGRFGMLVFDDPNKYALFLNLVYAVTLPKMIEQMLAGKSYAPYLLGILGVALILFLTQSRSGMLTFGVLTILGVWSSRSRKVRRYALLGLVPVTAVFLLAVAARYAGSHDNAVVSDLGRVYTYMVAWNIIQDRPFTGIGFGNIVHVYDTYGGIYYRLLGRALGIHNATLEIFAESGFFAMVTYLSIVFVPVGILLKRVAALSRNYFPTAEVAAVGIPLAFFCYGLFYVNYLADDWFWVYMVFTMVVLREPETRGELRFLRPRIL